MLDEVLDTVAHHTVAALKVSYCVIWEYEGGETIVERGAYEAGSDYRARGEVVDLNERPIERRILMGDAPVVETISDPGLDPGTRASMDLWGEKTCLSLPLRYGDERLGMLVVGENERERSFSPADLELASGLADQAALAVHNARLYADLEHRNAELADRARRQTLLNEVSRALSSSLVLDDVLNVVTRSAAEALSCPEAMVYTYDSETDTLMSCSYYCTGPSDYDLLGVSFPLEATDREIIDKGIVLVETLSDPDLPPPVRDSMEEWGEKTCLNVPLAVGSQRHGIMVLIESEAERTFTEEELSFARSLGEHAALAIHNARLYESVRGCTSATSGR